MRLSVKRKDSVISILLFIFNVFLVKRGITAIPLRKIFKILEPFQKNETAIRMGLSREIQNGLMVNRKQNGEVFYHLTDLTLEGFKYWMTTMDYDHSRIQSQLMNWNGSWSIFKINRNDFAGAEYNEFLAELSQLSYGLLSRNVWISPYHQTEQVMRLVNKYHLEDQFYIFECRLCEPASLDSLITTVWPINQLDERYRLFLKILNEEKKSLHPESFNGGGGLPFLYQTGLEYFNIVQDDPRLPLQLLPPGWLGLTAAKVFNQAREEVLFQAEMFIDNIINS